MKIEVSSPAGPYSTSIDTGAMDVTLFKVFSGVTLISEHGERLHICMRDSGFDVKYVREGQAEGPVISFNEGIIKPLTEDK